MLFIDNVSKNNLFIPILEFCSKINLFFVKFITSFALQNAESLSFESKALVDNPISKWSIM